MKELLAGLVIIALVIGGLVLFVYFFSTVLPAIGRSLFGEKRSHVTDLGFSPPPRKQAKPAVYSATDQGDSEEDEWEFEPPPSPKLPPRETEWDFKPPPPKKLGRTCE